MKEPEVLIAEARTQYRNASRVFWSGMYFLCVIGIAIVANEEPTKWPPVGFVGAVAICAPVCVFWHWLNVNVRLQVSDSRAEALRLRLLGHEVTPAKPRAGRRARASD